VATLQLSFASLAQTSSYATADGYLRGAVSQYRASKIIFLGGTKPIWGPKDMQNYFEINKG